MGIVIGRDGGWRRPAVMTLRCCDAPEVRGMVVAVAAAAPAVRRSLGRCRPLRCGAGLRGRWALLAGGGSLRLCSTRVSLEGINRPVIDRIIRVDHAGEYGANRIYAGQMAVLGRSSVGPIIQQMWNQEKDHLKKFNELMVTYRVRPTVLLPFWNVAGFVLGAGSALLGKKGAMACTVAVEESISDHYNNQIRTLVEEDPEKYKELLQIIKQFRDDEREHHDIGIEHDAEAAPAYSVLKTAIQLGCKAAIFLSERI